MGMWVPVYDEEWDGDDPLGLERPVTPPKDSEGGVVTFKGNALPWLVGRYEVNHVEIVKRYAMLNIFPQIRYHHDGKYNVMSLVGPLEIYG
jgi:phosphatidylethanolamine N-methyltransferase